MTAVRIEIPQGVAPPVWVAHVVRNAVVRAFAGQRLDPRSLRVEVEDENGAAQQALSCAPQAKHAEPRAPQGLNRGAAF